MILFRVDSSHLIGSGHIFRCLHMAELLRTQGHECQFVCRDLPGNIHKKVIQKKFKVHLLKPPDQDPNADIQVINELNPSWLVIDHYQIDHRWENQINSQCSIFVIDDLMNRQHDCEVLLDQNFRKDNSKYRNLVQKNTHLLLGPQHCLLPAGISQFRKEKSKQVYSKVISFFGGSDSTGECLKFAKAIEKQDPKFSITLVVLSSHSQLPKIQNLKSTNDFRILIDPPNWHQLLSESDFYFGSGGTVTWERLYLGLPGAVISVATNQEKPNEDLAAEKYQFYIGSAESINYETQITWLSEVLKKTDELNQISLRGQNLVQNGFNSELCSRIFNSV